MTDSPILRALSVAVSDTDTVPDVELLRRFTEASDGTAFELLVRRHAELVWGVCRAALPRDLHAAEDAFQATFLALARRAGTIQDRSAAGWLFRVARNAAGRVRSANRSAASLPDGLATTSPSVDSTAGLREVVPIVAEEIDRLAAKFRDPVVLCFYEGHTHAEAAERLGWSVGTVASRIARAKDRLRARLTRRGVTLPTAGVAGVLATSPLSAAPEWLVRSTVTNALGPVGQVPPAIHLLSQGVLSAMRFPRLKPFAVVATIALGLTAALVAAPWTAAEPPAPPSGKSAQPVADPGKNAQTPEAIDRKTLQGTWKVTKLVRDGAEVPTRERERMRWVFTGNDLLTTGDGADGRGGDRLYVKLVPVQSPKVFDLTRVISGSTSTSGTNSSSGATGSSSTSSTTSSSASGSSTAGGTSGSSATATSSSTETLRGIYELKDGTLRVCIRHAEHDAKGRPTAFEAGKTVTLMILERVTEADELKMLAGEWKVVTMRGGGNPPEDVVKKIRWTLSGAELVLRDGESEEKATIKLTPGVATSTIDITFTTGGPGPELGNVLLGIYALRGDQLTVCFTDPKSKTKRNTRPAQFRAGGDVLQIRASDDTVQIVLKRIETPAEALKTIQGSWKVLHCAYSGHEFKEKDFRNSEIIIRDDQLEDSENSKIIERMRVKLDPRQSPCAIDMTYVESEELKGKTVLGIYELKGNILTLCFRDIDSTIKDRPKEFKSEGFSYLMILERVPKK
jgi:RNA polymerase sigma factor (sigma-70 family)